MSGLDDPVTVDDSGECAIAGPHIHDPLSPGVWQEAVMRDLQQSGLRLTAPRKAIIDRIAKAHRPLTAGELAGGIDGASGHGSRATSYRLLQWLVERGWLARMLVDREDRITHCRQFPGHHVAYCVECGQVLSVGGWELDGLMAASDRTTDFTVERFIIQLQGRCGQCR